MKDSRGLGGPLCCARSANLEIHDSKGNEHQHLKVYKERPW